MSNYKDLSGKTSASSQKNTTLYSRDSSNVLRIKGFIFCLLPLLILITGIFLSIKLSADWAVDRYISALMPILNLDDSESEETSLFDQEWVLSDSYEKITFPKITWGDQFARLTIDSIGIRQVPVYHGDSETQLSKGIGHFSGSRFPGQGGNVVILAHRTMHFKPLQEIHVGDIVELETFYATYVYRVVKIKVLDDDDYSLIYPDDSSEILTMYTCFPFTYVGTAPERFYVICELVSGSRWDKETGTFVPYE